MRVILLFWILVVVACNNSSENFNIGAIETLVPKDSNAMYITIKKPDDSSSAIASSYFLFKFHEPVLSGYTGKTDIYRFTWIRTFHEPMMFRMQRLKDTVQLITKILEGKSG